MSGERIKNDLGQYFTPQPVAAAMVGLLEAGLDELVLEPSAGQGVFLSALEAAGFENVEGVEIDEQLQCGSRFPLHRTSFISWQPHKEYKAIIGNPPYIRWKNLDAELQTEVKQHRLWGSLFNSLSDYLTIFIAKAVEHLEDGGELVFITPSFWMGTQHSGNLREWLLKQGSFSNLILFGESEVFPKVSSAIIIFRFVKGQHLNTIRRHTFIGGRRVREPVQFNDPEQFQMDEIPQFRLNKHWTIASAGEQTTADELESACLGSASDTLFSSTKIARLGDYVQIANGMVSGMDKAFRLPDDLLPKLSNNEVSALMPVVKAHNLTQIKPQRITYYADVPSGLTEDEFKSTYPNIANHLELFRGHLEMRYSYGRHLPHWEWAFRRSERFLRSPIRKGFVPCKERLTNRRAVRFALVDETVVATQDMTAFAPLPNVRESIEYIVGYLCLPKVSDWVRLRGLMKGGVAEFSERPLADIPFRFIDWNNPTDVDLHNSVTHTVRCAWHDGNVESAIQELEHLFCTTSQRPIPASIRD